MSEAIGRGFRLVVNAVLWPFRRLGAWFVGRGGIAKFTLGLVLLLLVFLYGYFFWTTQRWTNFNPTYATAYEHKAEEAATGQAPPSGGIVSTPEEAEAAETAAETCRRSLIVEATANLVDFNVNQNAWISSMLLYKLGLFGLAWDRTPFFDNKASFQRGVNQAIRRTAIELVDTLGRVRGTSQIDQDLQKARGNLQFDEETWYFSLSPFGPKTPTPAFYRTSIEDLRTFNARLEKCEAVFDARADNLLQFIDRIANDIGATSAILRERSENYNLGWFDPRADDRFWFAYGQLYGYYGILSAARADFKDVIAQRGLTQLWDELEDQLRAALRIQPLIISNGSESGLLTPSHLATLGFYILRVRSNLVEIRLVLDR
ncbi:MAG TPA: DUF2333 family protein [Methyloceanibacter sp.]|nr:DUF2333 family protein [Methyloceanibacter sp.]